MLWSKTYTSRLCKYGSIHTLYGKGKEAHLRIFFISIVENLVNAYQNIIFIQPFKGVVILLARKIAARGQICAAYENNQLPSKLEVHFMFCQTFLSIMLYCIIRLEFFGSFLSYKKCFYQDFFSCLFSYKIKYSLSK